MAKYRTKPLTIEAEQWGINRPHPKVQESPHSTYDAWSLIDDRGNVQHLSWDEGWIETLEGGHIVSHGDYIVKGTHGEFYAVKPDIFEHKYEKVEEN